MAGAEGAATRARSSTGVVARGICTETAHYRSSSERRPHREPGSNCQGQSQKSAAPAELAFAHQPFSHQPRHRIPHGGRPGLAPLLSPRRVNAQAKGWRATPGDLGTRLLRAVWGAVGARPSTDHAQPVSHRLHDCQHSTRSRREMMEDFSSSLIPRCASARCLRAKSCRFCQFTRQWGLPAAQVRRDQPGKFVAHMVGPPTRCPVPPAVCN